MDGTQYKQVGPIHDPHGAVRPLTAEEMAEAHTQPTAPKTHWRFCSACWDTRGNVVSILLTRHEGHGE